MKADRQILCGKCGERPAYCRATIDIVRVIFLCRPCRTEELHGCQKTFAEDRIVYEPAS